MYIKALSSEIQHISGKVNAMADMLSRAQFEGEDGMVLEEEEVGVNFFELARLSANGRSTPSLHTFTKDGYEGGVVVDQEVPEHDGNGCIRDEGGSESDPEEGIQVLPTRWGNLANANGGRPNEVPTTGKGGHDEPCGRTGLDEQN